MNKEQKTIEKIQDAYYDIFGYENDESITLESVMNAINGLNIAVRLDGVFYYVDTGDIIGRWALNTPFHLQSKETKDFIGDLILNT